MVATSSPGRARPGTASISGAAVVKRFEGTRRRPGVLALDHVTFSVRAGEFLAIVGPSGCGKSTLLRMIAGLDYPTEGRIEVGGEAVRGTHSSRGFLFQSYALFPWKTVRQNIAFGPRVRHIPAAEAAATVGHFLDLVGLGEFADHYPHELSGGMQQRCALARLLANEPRVLLMDEPLAALDELTRRRLQDELFTILDEGDERKTAVYVTHSVEEAVFLADRVIVMSARPGRITMEVDVPFARPRAAAIRESQDFSSLVASIWKALGV